MTRAHIALASMPSGGASSGHENRHLEHQRRQGAAESAVTWLKETSPDVACFQEIKCVDEAFPAGAFEELGYNVAVHGQKGFNGVAILSKRPFDEVAVRGLPGDEADAHARYIEVVVRARRRRGAGRQPLPAQRQSHRHRQVRLQARLDAAPAARTRRPAEAGGTVPAGRRLQRHPRTGRRQEPAGLDRAMRCSSPRRGPPTARSSTSA